MLKMGSLTKKIPTQRKEGSMPRTLVLSTEASRYFAEKIAQQIDGQMLETERDRFSDGERYFRIAINDRSELLGCNVIVVGSTHTDEDFDEICRVGETAAELGARRVIYVIPFFGY